MEAELAVLELASKLKPLETLDAIILCDSETIDDINHKNHINILLLFNSPNNPEKGIESRKVSQVARIVENKYRIKKPFTFLYINQNETIEKDLLWEIVRDGILIYARPEILLGHKEYLKPMALISYHYNHLPAKEKAQIQRKLYGYQVRKTYKGKEYLNKKEGIVNQYGQKIGRATILIPAKKSRVIIKLFEKLEVKYNLIKIWT